MRVIAGEAKGRTLVAPRGGETRAATDRIRETLFAILDPTLAGADVLDLFAGAGTLGIEALSRGARHATFVERGREALAAIRRNLAATGFASRATVVPRPVRAYLDAAPPGAFGVVFVDPPFGDVATMNETLAHPALRGALAPGAVVIARSLRKHPAAPPRDASVVRTKPIGEEDLVFLRYSQPAAGGSLWTSSSS